MSANPSFFESRVIKGTEIIWTIDLTLPENSFHQKSPIKFSQPQNLLEFAQNYTVDLDSHISNTVTVRPQKDVAKTIRKLVKKIIKRKRIRLSELSTELQLSKGGLKKWLMKGENPEGDSTDYAEVFKVWLGAHKSFLSQDEMYDVINQFNKSMRKNLNKVIGENSGIASPILVEAIVIDNRFPVGKKIHREEKKESSNKLSLIQVDASINEISVSDSFLWDQEDSSQEALEQFALTLIKDTLEEQKTVASEQTIYSLINEIAKQIKDQMEHATSIKDQTQPLIEFNGNSTAYKQKEQILHITLDINEANIKIQDSFDWEVDPVLNQPEKFAEVYVKEHNLPYNLTSIIALQIREQIDEYLQKCFKNFSRLFEPKINEDEASQLQDDKRRLNNKIKKNILLSLNENLETFPIVPPFKNEQFLQNQELLALLNRYTDFLAPIHRKIYLQQKSFSASVYSQPLFKDPKPVLPSNKDKPNSKSSKNGAGQSNSTRFLQSTQKYIKSTQGSSNNIRPISAPVLANMHNNLPMNFMAPPMANGVGFNNGPVMGDMQHQRYMQYGQAPVGGAGQEYNFVQQENIQNNKASMPMFKMNDTTYLKG